MLIKNLSDTLVNGLCGTVTATNNESVDVKFTVKQKQITVTIGKEILTVFDPVDKIILAKRVQLPLKVGFAITIHKSQGMTLQNLVVDCSNCFQPGQLGVAIGRAVSVQGLKVINFKKNLCRRHPAIVYNFYDSFSLGIVKQDLSCCRKNSESTYECKHDDDDSDSDSDATVIYDKFEDDSDFSESEIDKLEFLDTILGIDHVIYPEQHMTWRQALQAVFSDILWHTS